MTPPPPISTLTDTLLPYTSLFRSRRHAQVLPAFDVVMRPCLDPPGIQRADLVGIQSDLAAARCHFIGVADVVAHELAVLDHQREMRGRPVVVGIDRKSTRLNSSH